MKMNRGGKEKVKKEQLEKKQVKKGRRITDTHTQKKKEAEDKMKMNRGGKDKVKKEQLE